MFSPAKIYRYLRYKDKFISGRTLAKAMGFPLHRLTEVTDISGVGSMGPCYRRSLKNRSVQFWNRYARCNAFHGGFRCFFQDSVFTPDGPTLFANTDRYLCIKDRPLRKGKSKPRRSKPK